MVQLNWWGGGNGSTKLVGENNSSELVNKMRKTKIRVYMEAKGIPLSVLVRDTGINVSTLQRFYYNIVAKGRASNPRLTTLKKIQKSLGCKLDDIC